MKLNFWPFNMSRKIAELEDRHTNHRHHVLADYADRPVPVDDLLKRVSDLEQKLISLGDRVNDAAEIKDGISQMTSIATSMRDLALIDGERKKEIAELRNRFNNVLAGTAKMDALLMLVVDVAKIAGYGVALKDGMFELKKIPSKKPVAKRKR